MIFFKNVPSDRFPSFLLEMGRARSLGEKSAGTSSRGGTPPVASGDKRIAVATASWAGGKGKAIEGKEVLSMQAKKCCDHLHTHF